ncbi:MAG: cysteine hydrolase [Chloroflexi bacterium]|nr:cysteine hydrolase [Chloroflexota bacterium]
MSSTTALLIIDLQTRELTGPYPVADHARLLHTARQLIDRARAAGVPIVFVRHIDPDDDPLDKSTRIHPDLGALPGDPVIVKQTPDAFHNTGLDALLQEMDINTVVIAGLQTELCIDATVRRAFSLGYLVTLVSDGHGTWDSELLSAETIIAHHNAVLGAWFATLHTADEVTFA